jgi:tryptophan synthase alpha chain
MSLERIQYAFETARRRGRPGIIPFLTTGFPSIKATLDLAMAMEEAGATLLELGIPFSDPIADGPTIQRASFHALENGTTLEQCLDVCRALRSLGLTIPLILMGYYNPFLSYGLERFAQEAAAAGVDGIIGADLPPEEAEPLKQVCDATDLALVPLLAPTSTDERVAKACATGSGFIYCVSVTGVTGAREILATGVSDLVRRVRIHTDMPVAIGFGISRPVHIETISELAEAAVVGSALINVIDSARRGQTGQMVEQARSFITELVG